VFVYFHRGATAFKEFEEGWQGGECTTTFAVRRNGSNRNCGNIHMYTNVLAR